MLEEPELERVQAMEIKESKVLKFKTLLQINFNPKAFKPFKIIRNHQISQIFVDLFAKRKHEGLVG